jgi:hypothetical protein
MNPKLKSVCVWKIVFMYQKETNIDIRYRIIYSSYTGMMLLKSEPVYCRNTNSVVGWLVGMLL